MKKITKFLLMLVVVMLSSGVMLAQLQISDLEKQMIQNFQPKELGNGSGDALPLNVDAATPITVFPFEEDFESGAWSPNMEPFSGLEADASIAAGEGVDGGYAAMLEGNSWSGFYHTTSCVYTLQNNRPLHEAGINMTVVPSGQGGQLTMRFDFDQFYSFAYYYDAFEVLVNGTAIPDANGTTCFYPTSPGGSGYSTLTFDLSAYQGDASFDLKIDFAGKYYRNYYQGGDALVIDNLKIFYLEMGDISVDVTADGAPLAGATVGIEDVNEYVTDATGHVDFIGLETGDYEVYAYKDGYNYASQTATVVNAQVTQVDFNLSPPIMVINPLAIVETLNPGEYLTTYIGIQNIGAGDLFWTAEIVYPPLQINENYPKYGISKVDIEYGTVANTLALDRSEAGDIVNGIEGTRTVGDVLETFTPAGNDPWGTAWDGEYIYLTNPWANGNQIHQYNLDGSATGYIINAAFGGSWIGDMACDGTKLYCCNVGGDNAIKVVDIATGNLLETVTGAWTITSQRGLAYDEGNMEYYIGGWNSNNIWRTDVSGGTIDQHAYQGVSGLTYHPNGGPDAEGSIWVVGNTSSDMVDEFDPNNGWAALQSFGIPSGAGYSGAGMDLNSDGNLWVVNQSTKKIYLVDTEEPLAAGGWLTLDFYEGNVPANGGSMTVPTNLNATGTQAGEVYNADIVFSANPNVSETTVPVTMIIAGDELVPATDLEAVLTNQITGQVNLSWSFPSGITFEYFLIRRNGQAIANTQNLTYVDMLPAYGVYDYTVAAVYVEGETLPAGPEQVIWFIPEMCWNPAAPENWQWIESEEQVELWVSNCGEGTLTFSFPDYVAQTLMNNPDIEHNNTDPIPGFAAMGDVAKGEKDPRDDQGHPIVLGAGDDGGEWYTWIDSDEAGGPTYEWVDISSVGSDVTPSGWDDFSTVTLPWSFNFYGNEFTSIKFATNGYLTFGGDGTDYTNDPIPSGTDPNDLIALLWDDLDMRPTDAFMYYYYDAANDRAIFSWVNGHRSSYTTTSFIDMQAILYPTGRIALNYKTVTLPYNSYTTGFENGDGTIGAQIAFNTGYLHSGLSIVGIPPTHFIIDVQPNMGQVTEGDSIQVMLTYSSVGYGVGDWYEDLYVTTNELAPDDEHMISNTMHVYTPGHLFGTVTDCNSGVPIGNVTVTAVGAETYFTETAENGTYDMLVDEDTYDVVFSKIGLQTTIVADTFATQGVMTEVSMSICEVPYPVGWVFLDPNEADTEALITWSDPMGPYEIIYDDGSAEDYAMWVQIGGKSAVRFTPAGYPARVQGGRIYVGDGSFPVGADFIGTDMAVGILDDDGMNGMPGTVLDSAVVTVNNYGWVEFGGFNRTIDDGDFYLVYWQLGTPPNAAPVGIDTDVPTVYRSYIAQAGTEWIVSPYQDFMMRAIVSGPNQNIMMSVAPGTRIIPPKIPANAKVYIATSRPSGIAGTVKGGTFMPIVNNDNSGDRNFDKYRLRWHDGFNPDAGEGPEDGEWHHRAWRTNNSYNDTQWGPRDPGFYAYSIQAKYESGDTSEWIYSNIAAHGLDNVATFTIEQCDDSVPDNIEVLLVGKNYPYQRLEGIATVIPADNQAVMVFDSVIDGAYDLTIFKVGYQRYFHFDIQIFNDYEEFIVLQENAFPPRNLYVDALTSVATWDPALIEQLRMETFEDETFPPAGWQATTLAAEGWFRSDDGGSDNFPIPAGDGFYAVDNDDKQGSISDGSMDYLITPMMDMRQSETYALYYDSYYTAANGQEAYIEYSTDAGATWEVFNTLTTPVTDWTPTMVDLAPLSGANGLAKVWFAFHADDGGNDNWASGWAIDNVVVHNGPAPNLGYYVYLDDSFVAQTAVGYETYTYRDLVYGVTYKASVRALYACGLSAPIDYWWTSTYLYPPRKLNDAYLYGTNEVPIYWFPPVTGSGVPMAANANYPKYDIQESNIEYGKVANTLAFNRSSANDIVHSGSGMRDYGDVVAEVTPQGIQPWGVAFDGEFLYVTDPFGSAGTVINQVNVDDGSLTGYTIDGSAGGPSWVGDMASDGTNIYACNVGGDNAINVYDIETGALINTVTGAWTVTSQRGLAYDQYNAEYYVGGWNSNNIWRTDDVGATIDEFGFAGVSGLAYHPAGGPNADGSLWVSANTADDLVTETDPNAGWPLLQNFGIPSAAGYSGAGLGLNSDGMLWVVNQSNGIIYLVDVDEPLSVVPIPEVPDGLIGFKVYQDAEWIADVPYNGEEYTDSIWYVVNPLDPDCYVFEVSAIYDLGVYGFPGEEGESALEGPDTVCVVWGYGLPFFEDWNEGDFAFNGWRLEDENWKMNSQVGDPEPSAEFTWDPLLENDYSSTLTTNPLLGDLLTEGDIFVDFNVKLADRNMTGEEKLLVEITNDAGDSWHQVAELTNANGSFDFADGFNHINITPQAMGHVFQVRFNAVGQNSFDIVSWYVDNINVYRTCGAPTDLSGIYKWIGPIGDEEWGAEVCWNAPELPIPPALWIFWDDGTYAGGVGLTDGGTWSLAQRWDAGQLTNWQGEDLSNAKITKMSFVLNDDGFSSITLKIWSGAEASTLLYEQVVASPVPGDWQEVTLDTPVDFDENDELWIGYTIADQPAGKFPGGNDAGPAVPGYGDMINTGGATWDKVSDFGIDKNWVVHAFAEELPTTTSLPTLVDNTVYSGNGELSESAPVDEVKVAPNTIERAFTGFSLYRQEVGVDDDYVLYQPIPYVEGQTEYCYFDAAPAVTAGHTYNYQVTSNWVGDTDACESDPALNIPMTEDFVSVLVTDIGDNEASETNLYPNPATDRVNVSSTQSMERITVLNYVGQVVFDQQLNGEKALTLNTASYEAGVYVVRIDTEDGTITRRVVITK